MKKSYLVSNTSDFHLEYSAKVALDYVVGEFPHVNEFALIGDRSVDPDFSETDGRNLLKDAKMEAKKRSGNHIEAEISLKNSVSFYLFQAFRPKSKFGLKRDLDKKMHIRYLIFYRKWHDEKCDCMPGSNLCCDNRLLCTILPTKKRAHIPQLAGAKRRSRFNGTAGVS